MRAGVAIRLVVLALLIAFVASPQTFAFVFQPLTKEKSFKLDTVDVSIPTLTVFHKKNEVHVIKQEVITREKKSNSFIIDPPKHAKRTTVQVGYFIYELFWD